MPRAWVRAGITSRRPIGMPNSLLAMARTALPVLAEAGNTATFSRTCLAQPPAPGRHVVVLAVAQVLARRPCGAKTSMPPSSWKYPDTYQAVERTLTLQGHKVDAQGRIIPEQRTLQVKIPKGVYEGQMIRLAGQGGPGYGGGAAGDLLLQVRLRPDSRWRAEGKDVYQRLRLSPWEIALGGSVQVETVGGSTVEVNVPAGSGSGRKLRLKGRGIPAAQPGDLYLEIEPAVPGAVTQEQRAAWQALAQVYPGFDPRRA